MYIWFLFRLLFWSLKIDQMSKTHSWHERNEKCEKQNVNENENEEKIYKGKWFIIEYKRIGERKRATMLKYGFI